MNYTAYTPKYSMQSADIGNIAHKYFGYIKKDLLNGLQFTKNF